MKKQNRNKPTIDDILGEDFKEIEKHNEKAQKKGGI